MWKIIYALAVIAIGVEAHGQSVSGPCRTSLLELSDTVEFQLTNMKFQLESMERSASQFSEANELITSDRINNVLRTSDNPVELMEVIQVLTKSIELIARSSITRRRIAASLSDHLASQTEIIFKRVIPNCLLDEG